MTSMKKILIQRLRGGKREALQYLMRTWTMISNGTMMRVHTSKRIKIR